MKSNIRYSILELAAVSHGSSIADTFRHVVSNAQKAEDYGYHRIWLAEHHNMSSIASAASPILIGKIAENTQSIRVGSGGIMLPNHSPLIIAEQFGTLAQLYPNRIDLGLGRAPGTDTETAKAIRSDFYQAAMDFPNEVEKIQQYFSTENKTSKVRVRMAEGAEVPIYILGSSTESAHLSARKGLPYAFASHFASTHLHSALQIYNQEFQPSEFLAQPYTIAGINVFVADSDEEAERLFTSLILMFGRMLMGKPLPSVQPPVELDEELLYLFNHPQTQQMLKYSFVGSKSTVKTQIKEFLEETKVDELITVSTMFSAEDRIKSIRLFSEVMQEINEENNS